MSRYDIRLSTLLRLVQAQETDNVRRVGVEELPCCSAETQRGTLRLTGHTHE